MEYEGEKSSTKKRKPSQNCWHVDNTHKTDIVNNAQSAHELAHLGMDVLKTELRQRGLKCGGESTLKNTNLRIFLNEWNAHSYEAYFEGEIMNLIY